MKRLFTIILFVIGIYTYSAGNSSYPEYSTLSSQTELSSPKCEVRQTYKIDDPFGTLEVERFGIGTTDNHCYCGAIDNGNSFAPPCKCKCWKWNFGKSKWVHNADGQCTCKKEQENHAPVGNSIRIFALLALFYALYLIVRDDARLDKK